MYKPKIQLLQFKGLKRHEDLIEAMKIVISKKPSIHASIIGGQWGRGEDYELKLKTMAKEIASNFHFLGRLSPNKAYASWRNVDCAVHIPASENCGGVIDPLFNEIPVISSDTGGLPEVIIDGVTGRLVPVGDPTAVAEAIVSTMENREDAKEMAKKGRALVSAMFDITRTSNEILNIYDYVLDPSKPFPADFDSQEFLNYES